MVVMATSMVRKMYNFQKNIIWISGYHFTMLWKGYHSFDFFHEVWKTYLEWYTNAIGVEHFKWSSRIWVIISIMMCGMKLLIHSQTSTVQPLKFGDGYVISVPIFLGMRLFIHVGFKSIYVSKSGINHNITHKHKLSVWLQGWIARFLPGCQKFATWNFSPLSALRVFGCVLFCSVPIRFW